MNQQTHWTHCRREGCGLPLPAKFQVYGFCDATCFSLHQEEKEFHLAHAKDEFEKMDALAAFRREGEPNGGRS